jgi:4,5-DOPA dioxygenase extradiol
MPAQPALFVSHGSPMIVLDESPARTFMEGFAASRAKPVGIIVASAHYEAPGPSLSAAAQPATVHDFGGFPPALYQIQYPAPGAPLLAQRAAQAIADAGFAPRLDPARGLDHGVWTPLKLIYPDADIPVVSLSVDPNQSPDWHYRLGQALKPLRADNVMIVGSGSATHNLSEYFRPHEAGTPEWVTAFEQWLWRAIEANRVEDLLAYRQRAPHGARNHPTEEHILPLFVALGAGDGAGAQRLHQSYDRVLAMDAFAFGA